MHSPLKSAMVFVTLITVAAFAQSPEDPEKFDAQLRRLGYASGQVYECRGTDDERKRSERNALNAFSGISRLFGSDHAFCFAAAYGAGARYTLDKSKCAEYIKRLEEIGKRVRAFQQEVKP